jgi:hypothetical protein
MGMPDVLCPFVTNCEPFLRFIGGNFLSDEKIAERFIAKLRSLAPVEKNRAPAISNLRASPSQRTSFMPEF